MFTNKNNNNMKKTSDQSSSINIIGIPFRIGNATAADSEINS